MHSHSNVLIFFFCTIFLFIQCKTGELARQTETGNSFIGITIDQLEAKGYEFCAGMMDGNNFKQFPQYSISTVSEPGKNCLELYVLLEKSRSRRKDGTLNSLITDVLFVNKKMSSQSLVTGCREPSRSQPGAYVIFPDSKEWENSNLLEFYNVSKAIGIDKNTEKLQILTKASLKCTNHDYGH